MKLYLADATINGRRGAHRDVQRAVGVLRLLISFHYYQHEELDALLEKFFLLPYPELFLDSGAFSAKSQGVIIDLAAYCAYIKKYESRFLGYANLDVIGDAVATLANQRRMEDAGLAPVPVFHVGEPWRYLEQYVECYPYVALGGMVPYMRDARYKLMPWLIRCFQLARGRTVYHGFGCTSWPVMLAFPWYSADSSGWVAGNRYGEVPLFDQRTGAFVQAHLGDRAAWLKYAAILRTLSYDPLDFADRSRNDSKKIYALSALSYVLAEQYLTRRHGEIAIPERVCP